jgi:hypothetical protein
MVITCAMPLNYYSYNNKFGINRSLFKYRLCWYLEFIHLMILCISVKLSFLIQVRIIETTLVRKVRL